MTTPIQPAKAVEEVQEELHRCETCRPCRRGEHCQGQASTEIACHRHGPVGNALLQRCENCGARVGDECRRLPPAPVRLTERQEEARAALVWPTTDASDWCALWIPLPETPEGSASGA